jgi:uncharacterized protein (TIGR02646 family)
MRAISKGSEPASLTAHRQTQHSNYNNYADKDRLRQSLVTEQQEICCYCMARIYVNSMKIEHWHSQHGYPQQQLYYRNLLGACRGGEGQPQRSQHCDTRKGDTDLQWNPADPTHHIETRIRYEPDGTIRSDEEAFDAQLNDVLNLNLPRLKNNRKSVYDAVLDWWRREKTRTSGPVPRDRLERERDRHIVGNRALNPFCGVSMWLLAQKIARMAA